MQQFQHMLAAGTPLKHYRIADILGIGGNGITYKAYDTLLNCRVAIKEYFPSDITVRCNDQRTLQARSQQDQQAFQYGLQRFLDEARILARFRVPSIVRVSHFLETNGTAYIIMDYEDGIPLNRYLSAVDTLTEDEIQSIILPILAGLQEVHDNAFLHRDIKPSNIFLRRAGPPVLLDFGAARQTTNKRTVTGIVTHGYAPFEQYTSRDKQGPWTDLYAIGATIYHCITGQPPINALDRLSGLRSNSQDPMQAASIVGNGKYSRKLLQITDQLLHIHAEDRPQTISEVLSYLQLASKKAIHMPLGIKNGSKTWDIETLSRLELLLAEKIGPIARTLVKRSAARASGIKELCHLLAEHIAAKEDQRHFLANTSYICSRPISAEIARAGVKSQASNSEGSPRALWDDETLRYAELQLARHLGPLASVLVKRAADHSMNMDEFITQLAEDIPTENERIKFRENIQNYSF